MADEDARGVGRRHFLVASGLVGGGLVAAAGGAAIEHARLGGSSGSAPDARGPAAAGSVGGAVVAFDGKHQPGVVDGAPEQLRFLAFDLRPTRSSVAGRNALREVLQKLTDVAREVMAAKWAGHSRDLATGLDAASLTVTVGIGAGALRAAGYPVHAQLAPLPLFRGDRIDPRRSDGDLGIQICGNDPMAVAAASRAVARAVSPYAVPRWSQGGFLRGAAAHDPAATPRNLMGQVDGTNNPTGARQSVAVWVPPGVRPSWMVGGTYLVCRRVRILLDSWEGLSVAQQERVMGRSKATGAPLTGQREKDLPDLMRRDDAGVPLIASDAHIRLAAPASNAGATMQRRGYNYDDGVDANGEPDAGLFFQSFQTDPHRVFVPVQRKLAERDALSRFIRHESSAVFAVLPGTSAGDYLGSGLFA